MKKMTKIISIIILIIISLLSILYLNFKESSEYVKFNNYERETMSIKYNNDNVNLIDNVKNIQLLAKKNNVIIAKSNVDNNNEKQTNVYLSFETIDELYNFLNETFNIKVLDNDKTKESFISTFRHNNNNQIGIINDLCGDHFYTYYLMDKMIEENDSLFGNYYIFYDDFQNYSNFVTEVNDLIGYDTHSLSFSTGIEKYLIVLIASSLAFLLLFYFVFQIYDYNNNSKKIGCMKLLGFDIKMINKNMLRKNIKIQIICSIIILFLLMIFIKNITLHHILFVFLINLFLILFTYFLSYLSCKIISKSYNVTNILKIQNASSKISRVSYKLKAVMLILLICFSVITFENIDILFNKLKAYNSSKDLLEYGVFQSYIADQPEIYDYDSQHKLYLDIVNNMNTIYAQFHDYSQYTQEDIENLKKAEEEGTFFDYNSVDNNYLKKEKIKVFDLNNNEVNIDEINSIYFLFPKSKKELIESFKKFNAEVDKYYLQFNDKYTFKAYLYDDQKINTYQIYNKFVDSSILRVIDDSVKYPSFYDGLGTSFFGEGLNTGLKIQLVDGNKEKTMEVLGKYIEDAKLSNLLNRLSFTTYKEYFNDEILISQLLVLFLTLAVILIFVVYFLISFQLLKLYIVSEKKRVLVKKLMGFDNNKIFEKVYSKNLNNTIIAILISFIVLVIIKKINIYFVFLILLFLVLDFFTTMLSIKSTKLSSIHLDLKGGNYD